MKNQQTDDRKKLIGDEFKLLEDHRKENKEIPIQEGINACRKGYFTFIFNTYLVLKIEIINIIC